VKTLKPEKIYDRKKIICCGWQTVTQEKEGKPAVLPQEPLQKQDKDNPEQISP
jgi:hypothetical protein